ncbi:MAG: Manganese/iron superoxide dismutase [Candidatus Doudnabacteria bacterium]|nr:Manganese/iron superoxide dismutase [Candidatus Doudnabacteria bacterium]
MYEAKKYDSIRELDGISEKTMTEHYKLYEGYVKKANEIEEKLKTVDRSTANQIYSDLRALKLEYSFAVGGIKNHEFYFWHLGGKGGEPKGALAEQIVKDFGSFAAFKEDMKQTGLAARGWVWLAIDWNTGKLFNYLGDAQNSYPIWNATPFVALDTYEHAYWLDTGSARATYIENFFKNLNWEVIEKYYDDATGMMKQ